jgi:hypothetical protein
MANKNIEQFMAKYGPVAQQVGKEINVDPNVLLSQWGLESRWGQTEMAKTHHNLGGIKDFSGTGFEAKDNKTGSMDKYVKFEDPEIFGMYYVDQIKRNFPQAANTGPDIGAFARGLAAGKRGSYFGVPVEEYESSLVSAQSSIPEGSLLPAGEQTETAPAIAAPAPETDQQRDARIQATVDAQEKRQAQLMGGAAGVGISATKAAGSGAGSVLQAGANRVGQGFRAGMQPPVVPGAPPAPGAMPGAAPTPTPTAAPPRNMMQLPIPSGGPDGGRLAPGQTGTMPFNYGKAAGLTDIEAGRALDMTKQAGGVHDLTTQRREGLGKVQSLFPNQFVENPRYGGIMTPDQGGGGGPRKAFTYTPPVAPSPEVPQGRPGGLSQLPPRQPISTAPVAPVAPKPPSGLDAVTNMFKGMMRPVATAAKAVGKYALPPLAVASAAGEGVNIAQQMRRPEGQRDVTGMALSGANILGSGLSMFPATAPVGVPLMLGTGAAQAYREDPEFLRRKMEGSADIPLLDEMTAPRY